MSQRTNNLQNGTVLRSPQQRKEILRSAITRAQSLKEAIGENAIQSLESCMAEADTINLETTLEEKIHNQEEVLMDSEMMSISSKVLKNCTKSLTKSMYSYNYPECAQKFVQYVQQLSYDPMEEPDWSLLEAQATKSLKVTPCYSTLLGTLAPLEVKTVKRRQVVREAQAAIKRPKTVTVVEKTEESVEQMVQMRKFVTRYYKTHSKPVDFFKSTLHPTNYGKTIENLLHASFLVRDGRVKLTKDRSEMLVMQPCTKDMTDQINSGKTSNIQNCLSLNMKQWKILNDIYQLEKPMIDFGQDT